MIEYILTISGGLLLVFSIVFYWQDCKDKSSVTMGGEMSFSIYWVFATMIILLGSLSLLGLSYWWTIPGTIGLYVVSFPIRSVLQYFFCTPYKKETTGFQKYIRKTEGTDNKAIDSD